MRFLKKKVFLYDPKESSYDDIQREPPSILALASTSSQSDESHSPSSQPSNSRKTRETRQRKAPVQMTLEPEKGIKPTSSKTIVKNFGKAMCSFGASELAIPYLTQIVGADDVNKIKPFQIYIGKKKSSIDSIESLRGLLLNKKGDDREIIFYKTIFREISIVFIKYFSVNWIFQGKMSHKQAHLRARFKMLRRVQSPEHFTYFKGFVKDSNNKGDKL